MTQQVDVILTLEVCTTQSKKQIEKFVRNLINANNLNSISRDRDLYDINRKFKVKEEAEIYGNE